MYDLYMYDLYIYSKNLYQNFVEDVFDKMKL